MIEYRIILLLYISIKEMKFVRKILSVVLAISVFAFCILPITVMADYQVPSHIRIGLMYGNSSETSVTLNCDYGFKLGSYNQREFIHETTTSQTSLTVTANGSGGVDVLDSSGSVLYTGTSSAGVLPNASGMDQKLKIDGVEYRGGVDALAKNGSLTIVNVVFMDHYLYGVISREMSPSWPIEALKAQAVCARNYAIKNLDKHSNQGFDLCANVDCQAYAGTSFESAGSYEPVDSTTRQVLTYDGEIASLFYSSSMGPTTEDVSNVWGNSIPYLTSVDNSYEDTENIPNGIWSGSITCDEASAIMRNKGYDIGEVTNIEVTEYTESGRVLHMKVTGTKGTKTFDRESCRLIFNTVTKSQYFTVVGDGASGKQIPKIRVTDGTDIANHSIDKIIMLTSAGRSVLEGNVLYVTNGVSQETYEVTQAVGGANTSFYFSGTGWGHGVGMSQYGAKGMAEAGYDYITILRHYFVGTNLENAY